MVREQRHSRSIVLCTASDRTLAEGVATHVGVFDDVLASDGQRISRERTRAPALVARFGERGFDYVGNATVDLLVWKHAHSAVVVESDSMLSQAAEKHTPVERRFVTKRRGSTHLDEGASRSPVDQERSRLPAALAAHRVFDVDAVVRSLLAFVCFGLCASSVYLTNDLLDLSSRSTTSPQAASPIRGRHVAVDRRTGDCHSATHRGVRTGLVRISRIHACTRRLLRAYQRLLAPPEANDDARCRRARHALYDTNSRRHRSHSKQALVLAARILDVHLSQLGNGQTVYGTVGAAA